MIYNTIIREESAPPSVSRTWTINNTPTLQQGVYFVADFSSVAVEYTALRWHYYINETPLRKSLRYEKSDGTYIEPYSDTTGWIGTAYRTLVFVEEPTGDLLTWLQANATKQ